MTEPIELAVLGGSGFYEMPGLDDVEELAVDTPFGAPSDNLRLGRLAGVRVAFLARHGRHHTLLPSEIPQRANFWAFKKLGVKRVLAVSAVGSLREDYRPGEQVVPDQLVDRTLGARPATFFGEGLVAHVAMADPFCPAMRAAAIGAAGEAGATVHDGGVYVVIEGPQFGTRAESELYRSWGISVVGMTALPEAKLAREAEICYAVLASVTDYDSWHRGHDEVDAATIFATLRKNIDASRVAVRALAANLPSQQFCGCAQALDPALATPEGAIPAATLDRLRPILSRRLALEARR